MLIVAFAFGFIGAFPYLFGRRKFPGPRRSWLSRLRFWTENSMTLAGRDYRLSRTSVSAVPTKGLLRLKRPRFVFVVTPIFSSWGCVVLIRNRIRFGRASCSGIPRFVETITFSFSLIHLVVEGTGITFEPTPMARKARL